MDYSQNNRIWVAYPRTPYAPGNGTAHSTIRVLIVDDHPTYRRDLRQTLEHESDIEVVGDGSNSEQVVEQAGRLRPDIVLMGVDSSSAAGIDATRTLTDAFPGIRVVLLGTQIADAQLREARRAGASACLKKDEPAETLLQTLRNVMSGANPLLHNDLPAGPSFDAPPHVPYPAAEDHESGYFLTSNERAILKLLSERLDPPQIAEQTGLPESMVRTYIAEINRKLGRSAKF